jgi:predicted CDP-diglyceride synthetase/phosphatidate cytidylyltransferase
VPRNPFGNELFLPVFLWVMLLIVVGLLAVLVAQRRSLRVWRRSTLFQRARTWFVIGPLFVLAVFIGGFVAFLLATFVLLQGLSEFARMAGIQRPYAYLLLLWGEVGLLVAALARDFFGFLPFGFFILLTLVPILSGRVEDAHRQVADTLVGYVFVGLPMAYIVFVNSAETWGLNFLVIVTVSVAVADIAGYAVGAGLRGPKLVPRVDPWCRASGRSRPWWCWCWCWPWAASGATSPRASSAPPSGPRPAAPCCWVTAGSSAGWPRC